MRISTTQFFASVADPEYEDMAHFHSMSKEGYWFSLSRALGASLIEVMVRDQVNFKTADIQSRLCGNTLHVAVSEAVALRLDGHTDYEIHLQMSPYEQQRLHEALSEIFKGVGYYEREA
jgi:hypothetical protein